MGRTSWVSIHASNRVRYTLVEKCADTRPRPGCLRERAPSNINGFVRAAVSYVSETVHLLSNA